MKLKLQTRYSISIVLVIGFVVLILSGALLFQFRKSTDNIVGSSSVVMDGDLLNQLKHRGATLVKLRTKDLINPLYRYDIEAIESILKSTKNQEDVKYVYLYDTQGRLMHDGDKWYANSEVVLNDEMGKKALAANMLFVQTTDEVVDVASPILIGDQSLGGVRVGLSKEGIKKDIENFQVQLDIMGREGEHRNRIVIGVLSIFLCLVGLILAIWLSRNLSGPIVNLSKLAARVGQGEYNTELMSDRSDEIGDLAVSFKTMAEDLQKKTVSKQYVDNIIDQMIDTLAVVSLDGKITKVNRALCEVLEYSESELVGEAFEKILGDESFKRTWLDHITKDLSLIGIETSYMARGSRKISVHFSGALMRDSKGEAIGVVCVAQDITQLKKHEKFAAIGQLAASVAHELRNPLGAIQNALFYIRGSIQDSSLVKQDENILQFIDIAGKEITRSNKIISELLDYSREIKLNLLPTDIASLIEEASHALKIPDNIKFSLNKSEVPITMVDPQKMHQVFVNLSMNAIQAMPQGGELTIQTFMNGDASDPQKWITIQFKDSGVGIPEENIKHIFEPLFTTKTKGTGLGLAICQEVIKAHSGKIEVKSDIGQGSVFMIKIPFISTQEGDNNEQTS